MSSQFLERFWRARRGQDLIEYTLLMVFVALASAALFVGAGGNIKSIWSSQPICAAGQVSTPEKPCRAPATANEMKK